MAAAIRAAGAASLRTHKKARNGRLRQGLIDKMNATDHFLVAMSDVAKSPPHDQTADLVARLRAAGLRPTRQRLALAALLFDGRHRHVSADSLTREYTIAVPDASVLFTIP